MHARTAVAAVHVQTFVQQLAGLIIHQHSLPGATQASSSDQQQTRRGGGRTNSHTRSVCHVVWPSQEMLLM